MDSDEILEFLFGKQAREDLERWGLPPMMTMKTSDPPSPILYRVALF